MYKYKFYFSIFLIFTLISCTPRHRGTNVDSELLSIYVQFIEDAKTHGIDINDYPRLSNLNKNTMSDNDLGICITDANLFYKYRNIHINEKINDEFILKYIVYHEIGHCIFGLGHDDKEGVLSIMSSEINILYRDQYEEIWDDLLIEFFKQVKGQKTDIGNVSLKCTLKVN